MKKVISFALRALPLIIFAVLASCGHAKAGMAAATIPGLSLARISGLADNDLSNYDGDDAGRHGFDDDAIGYDDEYTGFGDDHLDFGGKTIDFANEVSVDRVFTIIIVNGTAATVNVLLCPSYTPSVSANVINDGAFIVNMTATGAPKTIANLISFIGRNPIKVLAIKVSSTVAQQLAEVINIVPKSPFKTLETNQITLGSFTSEANQNDKMVTVNLTNANYQFDDQTEWNVNVPVGTSTFTFYFGATLNSARALNQKSQRAHKSSRVQNTRALLGGRGGRTPGASQNRPAGGGM
jgi:hypothetical protein